MPRSLEPHAKADSSQTAAASVTKGTTNDDQLSADDVVVSAVHENMSMQPEVNPELWRPPLIKLSIQYQQQRSKAASNVASIEGSLRSAGDFSCQS